MENLTEEEQLALTISESLKSQNATTCENQPGHTSGDFARPQSEAGFSPFAAAASNRKQELRLVFLGMTGAGKSSSANTVIGREEFKADCHGTSITYYCKHANAKVQGRDIVVVDTPGLFDTRQGNDDTMREITRCVCLTAPGPHALILVVRGGDRQTQQVQKCADIIMDVFGHQARRHMIILFTHRDDLDYHGQSLHDFIQTLPPQMTQVLSKCGNRYIAFNNRVRSAAERDAQVKELFVMVDKVISQNGGRCFTNDVYKDFEKLMVARERKLKEHLEKQKAEELQIVQERVAQETQRQMNILRDKERQLDQEREQRERERERQYQRESEMEREREREREMNAWKMKQEDIDRERQESERREREREQRMEQEKQKENERQRKEEQLNLEKQQQLEAKMNEKMNEKLREQDEKHEKEIDNLRAQVRNEVQEDEKGAGELIFNGLALLSQSIVNVGGGLIEIGRGVTGVGQAVGGITAGVKTIWKSIFG